MFFNEQGRLCSMFSWTSLAERDLFDQASAGRSWFRPDDLLRLSALESNRILGVSTAQ
jgi:hypothetical protein